METIMWIARDEDGSIWLHLNKPSKWNNEWFSKGCGIIPIDKTLFPEIKWEDSEPTKATMKISL